MYFPYENGRYEVGPQLFPLTRDFGHGDWDQKLFQLDADFERCGAQARLNRQTEPLSKYVCLSPQAEAQGVGSLALRMAERLAQEYPGFVKLENQDGQITFTSKFTEEQFILEPQTNSVQMIRGEGLYENAFDAISSQVCEDTAIWRLNEDGSEEIEALHLNSPNHWAAEAKIGKSFAEVHRPVAHIERVVPWAVQILKGILEKGPYVRFAWGVGTDDRLNHHPETCPDFSDLEWQGRRFDPLEPILFVRVERQVLWGFPGLKRALFTIRTYFQDVKKLVQEKPEMILALISSLKSMSPESLQYKGLAQDLSNILNFLEYLHRHELACQNGKDFYLDPQTGYQVMTRNYLLSKATCCQSNCRHCPYK